MTYDYLLLQNSGIHSTLLTPRPYMIGVSLMKIKRVSFAEMVYDALRQDLFVKQPYISKRTQTKYYMSVERLKVIELQLGGTYIKESMMLFKMVGIEK